MSNIFVRRLVILIFSFLIVFSSAASCNFFGSGDNNSLRYGILKSDPSLYQGGFAFVNSVKNFRDNNIKDGLNSQSGVKIVQTGNNQLFYIAKDKGLFTTDNGGKEWKRIYIFPIQGNDKISWDKSINANDDLKINNIAFVNQQIFYVSGAKGNISYLYRTIDEGKTFVQVYNTETNNNVSIEQILVDPRPNQLNTVYISTSGGAMFVSNDNGSNWKTITIPDVNRNFPLQFGVLSQYNSNSGAKFFILFKGLGLYLSDDGQNYVKADILLEELNTSQVSFVSSYINIEKIVQSPNTKELLLIADRRIYLGANLTQKFQQIKIPVETEKVNITDIAVDPKQGTNKLLMSVDSKLFESKDRGNSWSVNDKVNQSVEYGNISQIVINPEDTNIVYLMLIDPSYKRGSNDGFFFGV